MATNIYLDIDGVLLINEKNLAPYAKDFVSYVIKNFPDTTYWLTTHCQGDPNTPIEHIGHLFTNEEIRMMKKIKPTNWNVAKPEAIDFSQPFLWFDDDCFDFEKAMLEKHGALENWIEVDLRKNPRALKDFLDDFPLPVNTSNI